MDFFKLAVNLARAQAKGIKHEDDGILSCKHHPDNGGDCRFHKLQC
jgi:glutamine amidotransferase PdxT